MAAHRTTAVCTIVGGVMTELQGHEDRLEISADSGVFVRSRAEGSHGRSRVGGSAVQHPHCAREQGATNRTHGISTEGSPKSRIAFFVHLLLLSLSQGQVT